MSCKSLHRVGEYGFGLVETLVDCVENNKKSVKLDVRRIVSMPIDILLLL